MAIERVGEPTELRKDLEQIIFFGAIQAGLLAEMGLPPEGSMVSAKVQGALTFFGYPLTKYNAALIKFWREGADYPKGLFTEIGIWGD